MYNILVFSRTFFLYVSSFMNTDFILGWLSTNLSLKITLLPPAWYGKLFWKYLIHIRLEATRHKMTALARLHMLTESSP